MMWIWLGLGGLVVVAVGTYFYKARQARRIDVLDAQRTAMSQLRSGTGIRPEDR